MQLVFFGRLCDTVEDRAGFGAAGRVGEDPVLSSLCGAVGYVASLPSSSVIWITIAGWTPHKYFI